MNQKYTTERISVWRRLPHIGQSLPWLLLLLLFSSHSNAQIGALHPVSDSWMQYINEKYNEILHPETKVAIVQASGKTYPIDMVFFPRSMIRILETDGQYKIHLVDTYEDDQREFFYITSKEDAEHLISFFSFTLRFLNPENLSGLDGRSYFVRAAGAKNEFGYTWSPDDFTFADDVVGALHRIRDDCIRCIGDEFNLSSETLDFFRIVKLTPDSLRQKYIEQKNTTKLSGPGPVDPFARQRDELSDAEKDARIADKYRSLQLDLQYKEERLGLLKVDRHSPTKP